MKRFLLLCFICFTVLSSFSQEQETVPVSWRLPVATHVPIIQLPVINLEALAVEDSINDLDKTIPWRYGVERPLHIDFTETGAWTSIPNVGRIWRGAIKSPNALNLSVNFNNFYLPKGTTLHLYNNDRSEVSQTYSSKQNRANKILGSWFVSGDLIWIEYFEPENVNEMADLTIGSIIHGYRMDRVSLFVEGNRGINDSGACNYDVNCPIGDDFESKKNVVKKAVALLTLGNGYLCSAALVNNSQADKTPYLLTANHCLDNSDPAFWTVRFNWMSPGPVCGTGEESPNLQTNFTMSGAELKAHNALTDFALVEMYNAIPQSWDLTFAGWDNTDENPEFEVGIHHPNGDIMKICRDDSGAVKENANGTEVWLIGGESVGTGDGWEIGTTESGSSGSPLFNQDGRIIGQLYAGQSFCDGLQNNNEYDIYGRFGISWNAGATPESRLSDWLDPIGTGVQTMESLQNILNVAEVQEIGALEIYPNPATTSITVLNGKFPNLTFKLFTTLGQQLKEGSLTNTMNSISLESFDEGVYFLYLLDVDSESTITKKIVIDR